MTVNEHAATRTQHEIWNGPVGAAWVRHAEIHDQQAAPFGEAAMDAVGPVDGARVLDVGCGTGATVTQLLSRGAGAVLGIDMSVPMIDAARARNQSLDARFEAGDVLDLQPSEPYDVIFSRFGVMFFADPSAAFEHLRTLAARPVRLGFCCWGPPAANPLMAVPVMATIPVLGPPRLAAPGEPGPFSLSSPELIRDVLGAAGWSDITVGELTIEQPHPAGDADAVADVVVEFSPPIVEGLLRAPERGGATRAAIAEALRPLERNGVVHLRASALIVTAQA